MCLDLYSIIREFSRAIKKKKDPTKKDNEHMHEIVVHVSEISRNNHRQNALILIIDLYKTSQNVFLLLQAITCELKAFCFRPLFVSSREINTYLK